MIWTVTGHRPNKLGGYGSHISSNLVKFAKQQIQLFGIEEMNNGLAIGWDMACGIACIELGIPFSGYIPFIGQENRWSDKDKSIYNQLVSAAKEIIIISPEDTIKAFHDRNRAMVDDCEAVLALYNGEPRGGTYTCVRYAVEQGRRIENVWLPYCQFTTGHGNGPGTNGMQSMQTNDSPSIDYNV